jgi:hypothetical protein
MPTYLTKSDFKIARDCAAKLYLKKKRYPTTMDSDPYLQMLAEGGYIVEEVARKRYPDGIAIDHSQGNQAAIHATGQALAAAGGQDVVLFEPTFEWKGMLVRVDIFCRYGNTIELIEVKAKSWETGGEKANGSFLTNKGTIYSNWKPYVDDVAFQTIVLEGLFPEYTVIPYLMMPDKAKTASESLQFSNFKLTRHETVYKGKPFVLCEVEYLGEPLPDAASDFLSKVNATDAVAVAKESAREDAQTFLASLDPLERIEVPVGKHCFGCEYRLRKRGDGYEVCWGERAHVEPNIADMYYASSIKDVNTLISNGVTNLTHLQPEQMTRKCGTPGKRDIRRVVQIEHTRSNTEWCCSDLGDAMSGHPYPHHFIDFEATRIAVPYHSGMRPYQQVAFQWSCHTVHEEGAEPEHAEWINTEDYYPNFDFARSLMEHIGNEGTVFIWSAFERTALRGVLQEMLTQQYDDPELLEWLRRIVAADESGPFRMVDMYTICREHYFHPRMEGKTSIKRTLDAVWQEAEWLREEWKEYLVEKDGEILGPYAGLPPVVVGETEVDVANGTGAIRAYEAMLYGQERDNPAVKAQWKEALLRYCKLDTAAMVMIWEYWRRRVGT